MCTPWRGAGAGRGSADLPLALGVKPSLPSPLDGAHINNSVDKHYFLLPGRKAKRRKREERGATLVGIGDFALKDNTRSIIHGHQHAPNQGIRKALLQRPGVVVWDIDEYHTSKMCYQRQSVDCEMDKAMLKKKLKKKVLAKLEKEHKEVPKEEAVACYHVLRCNQCRIPVQRDVNACLNILRLTRGKREGLARPHYLSRNQGVTETTGKLDQQE